MKRTEVRRIYGVMAARPPAAGQPAGLSLNERDAERLATIIRALPLVSPDARVNASSALRYALRIAVKEARKALREEARKRTEEPEAAAKSEAA